MTIAGTCRRQRIALATLLLAVAGCNGEPGLPQTSPTGPASVEIEAVHRHAEQFDSELRGRTAGSQQEFAAAAYIVAHLQQGGYVARLEPVPVGNLVESSNVVALAPTGEPNAIVIVPYDATANGTTIGLWLEIARALRASEPDHAVQLVALGAEEAAAGRRGTRRLIRMLQDDGTKIPIVSFEVAGVPDAAVSGPDARDLAALGQRLGIEVEIAELDADDLWTAAGFAHTHISGPLPQLARLLVEFLSGS